MNICDNCYEEHEYPSMGEPTSLCIKALNTRFTKAVLATEQYWARAVKEVKAEAEKKLVDVQKDTTRYKNALGNIKYMLEHPTKGSKAYQWDQMRAIARSALKE